MKLYFNPLACSLASRITVYDAGLPVALVEVDTTTKRGTDGSELRALHPLGLVPTLLLDDGQVLTENAAVLPYLADLGTGLAPRDGLDRARLHEWIGFIGTELHKALFVPLLDKKASAEVKAYALAKAASRLGHVAAHLATRDYLLGSYSVADAYLFAVLNWAQVTPVKLAAWPALTAFMARMTDRPAVARAVREELALYLAEQQRGAV